MRGNSGVECQTHNLKVGCAIQPPATNIGETMTQEEKDPVKEQDQKREDEEFEYIEKIQKLREDQLKKNPLMDAGY